MKRLDLFLLITLAAIWGASFLFMRIASPEFGPVPLMFIRISVALLCFLPVLTKQRNRQLLASNWKALFFVGLTNSALPFCLFAYATLTLEAGFTSLLNATTPLFASIVGYVWIKIPLKRQQVIGLLLGFVGVAIISKGRFDFSSGGSGFGVIAGLCATFSYGIAAHYTKKEVSDLPTIILATGNMLSGTIILLFPTIYYWPQQNPSLNSWISALLLAIACTAAAYLLYFKLIRSSGANVAATVTFIIPLFSLFWGWLFLNETISLQIVIGMLLTLIGTSLTLKLIGRKVLQNAHLKGRHTPKQQ